MILPAAALAAVFTCAGCDRRTVQPFEIGDLDVELGFVAVFNDRGELADISESFGVGPGQEIRFGRLPSFELPDEESTAVLVALESGALAEAEPQLRTDRVSEVRVEMKTPEGGRTIESVDGRYGVVTSALPDPARFYSIDGAEVDPQQRATVKSSVRLLLPVDFEPCAIEGASELTAIAGFPESWEAHARPNTGEIYIRELSRLAADRLLAVTWSHLLLIDPARPSFEPVTSTTGPTLALALSRSIRFSPTEVHYTPASNFAVDPQPGLDGRRTVVITGGDPGVHAGVVWIATAAEDGLRFVETATLSKTTALGRVAIGDDGRILIGAHNGPWLLERPAGESRFRMITLEARLLGEDSVNFVTRTGSAEVPFAVGTRGRVHFWNEATQRWSHEDLDQEGILLLEQVRITAMSALPAGDGFELWVGAQYGQIFRRSPSGAWTRFTLPIAPRAYGCYESGFPATPIGGLGTIAAVRLTETRAFASLGHCTGIIVVDRADVSCGSAIPIGGEVIGDQELNLNSLDHLGGSLIVGGDNAFLRESRW